MIGIFIFAQAVYQLPYNIVTEHTDHFDIDFNNELLGSWIIEKVTVKRSFTIPTTVSILLFVSLGKLQ